MIRLLLLGFAALALHAPAYGDSRSLRTIYVQAPQDAPAKVYLVFGQEIQEVDLHLMSISEGSVSLPEGPLRVYAALKPPTKEEPLPDDAPFADIPEGMKTPLLVLVPNGSPGPLAFRMMPVEFSLAAAPPGAVLWFNLSDRTVYAKLGTVQAIVPPHRTGFMVPSGRFGEDYPVMVDLSPGRDETETLPFLRSRWIKDSLRRDLFFIVNDPDRSYPQALCAQDVLRPEPEQPKDKDPRQPKDKDGKQPAKKR